jgi:hypothetical protein
MVHELTWLENAKRVPGLPIRDCTRIYYNHAQMCPQLSAIDVTEKTFFERLYLVLGLGTFGFWVNCLYASTTLSIHCTTISRFLSNFFPRMAPHYFWYTIHQVSDRVLVPSTRTRTGIDPAKIWNSVRYGTRTHLTWAPHVPLDWRTRTRTRIDPATIWTGVCYDRNWARNNLNRCLLWAPSLCEFLPKQSEPVFVMVHELIWHGHEGTGTRPDYLVNRHDKKIEGPFGAKICTEIEK